MNVAIIGSRDFKNKNLLDEKMKEIKEDNNISLIVSGGALILWVFNGLIKTILKQKSSFLI